MDSKDGFIGVGQLLTDLNGYSPLKPAEEIALFKKIAKKPKNLLECKRRAELMREAALCNVPLLVSIAKHWVGNGVGFQDLIQEGYFGLMRAVEKFDLTYRCKFSTYASLWIRRYVITAIIKDGATIRIPSNIIEERRRLKKLLNLMASEKGDEPSHEEIAVRAGIKPSRVRQRLATVSQVTISLSAPAGVSDSFTVESRLCSTSHSALSQLEMMEEIQACRAVVAKNLGYLEILPIGERDKFIFKTYFRINQGGPYRTLNSVGEEFGLTRERVRQINKSVWYYLRVMGGDFYDGDAFDKKIKHIENLQKIVGDETSMVIEPTTFSLDERDRLLAKLRVIPRFCMVNVSNEPKAVEPPPCPAHIL